MALSLDKYHDSRSEREWLLLDSGYYSSYGLYITLCWLMSPRGEEFVVPSKAFISVISNWAGSVDDQWR